MTITEWVNAAPPEVAAVFTGNMIAIRALRDLRSTCFQMIGRYDGSISDESRASFQRQYDALSEMVEAFRSMTPAR